eukprot:PhM_4_TR11707/c3_g1_i3/m.86086
MVTHNTGHNTNRNTNTIIDLMFQEFAFRIRRFRNNVNKFVVRSTAAATNGDSSDDKIYNINSNNNTNNTNNSIRRIRVQDPVVARRYPNNEVINSKYTPLTFIPKNVQEQFARPLNQYFLLIALLQF